MVDAAGDELALRRAGSERAVPLVERPGVGWRRSCTTQPCWTTPCSWEPSRVGRARLHGRAAARTDGRPARAASVGRNAPHRSGGRTPISTSGDARERKGCDASLDPSDMSAHALRARRRSDAPIHQEQERSYAQAHPRRFRPTDGGPRAGRFRACGRALYRRAVSRRLRLQQAGSVGGGPDRWRRILSRKRRLPWSSSSASSRPMRRRSPIASCEARARRGRCTKLPNSRTRDCSSSARRGVRRWDACFPARPRTVSCTARRARLP